MPVTITAGQARVELTHGPRENHTRPAIDSLFRSAATPSTFTCPECQASLWELIEPQPRRFRCHTGHSFTAPILGDLQHEKAEAAIWAAVRSLQEKEQLFASPAAKATAWLHPGTASEYTQKARQAREQADLLKRVLLA